MRLSLPQHTKTVIKVIQNGSRNSNLNTPSGTCRAIEEEKEEFLKHGKFPEFRVLSQEEKVRPKKKHVGVSFEFLPEAKRILNLVNGKFGNGDRYLEEVFGEPITQSEASKYLVEYLQAQGLEGALRILWTKELSCCGRILWVGPEARLNKPEKRRYSLWLNSTPENVFLREHGIKGFADHEIGTHYLRMVNDGFQPWFPNRKLFGLRSLNSRHLKITEEGFAAINTLLQLNSRLLWWPAFLYYTACMSIRMTFKELFDHLFIYIRDADQRWKHVMRVKRYLEDYSGYGGTGKDQSYFAGAVRILRNADDIDFKLLSSGKLCYDELQRVKRVSRRSVKLPHFLDNITLYRHVLNEMLCINGLQPMAITNSLRQKPIAQKDKAKGSTRRRKLRMTSSRSMSPGNARSSMSSSNARSSMSPGNARSSMSPGNRGSNQGELPSYGDYEMFSIHELTSKLVC